MADEQFDDIAYLYDDVLSRLRKGENLSDIDTDTLVEVYDYAYDMSDEFVCSEVLDQGLRREPDCIALIERKAIRYLQQSEIEGAKIYSSRLSHNSFIRKLITTHLSWNQSDWENCYKNLFKDLKHNSIDDFGAVTLIDVVLGVDSLDNLAKIAKDILGYFRYPSAFLADLANALIDNRLFIDAVDILQELSILEPFNIEHWITIADINANQLNALDDAYSAIDYALALNPDDSLAKLKLGEILYKSGPENFDRVVEIADGLINSNERTQDALYLKAEAFIGNSQYERAVECLKEYLKDSTNKFPVFSLLITLSDGLLSEPLKAELIQTIKTAPEEELTQWIERSRLLLSQNMFRTVVSAIEAADVPISSEWVPTFLMFFYKCAAYQKVVSLYEKWFGTEIDVENYLIYAFASVRTGKSHLFRDTVKEMFERAVHELECGIPAKRLLLVSLVNHANALGNLVEKALESGKPIDSETLAKIDPFLT